MKDENYSPDTNSCIDPLLKLCDHIIVKEYNTMTCIVGMKKDGKVYIGGDSLGSNSLLQKTVRADEKVFSNGDFIFGFTSSFRMGQILRYSFTPPDRPEKMEDDMDYLVSVFIPALIKCFDREGYGHVENNVKTGGVFLLGYKGELYMVEEDYQVGKPTLPYEACGCGEDFAKGAMHVLMALSAPEASAQDMITFAIQAAAVHSAGVAEPIKIVST